MSTIRTVLAPVIAPRTYLNLLYLLVSLPLLFVYSGVLGFGFVAGLLLSVAVVGIAILAGTVVAGRAFAGIERRLANATLGVRLGPYDDVERPEGVRFSRLRGYVDAPSTWRGLGFVSLKFAVGIATVFVVIFLATALALLGAPVRYPYAVELVTVNDEPVVWSIETARDAVLAFGAGAVAAVVLVHVWNALAYVVARMARGLLGNPR